MKAVVFLGPTLAVADAQAQLDAIYLPPAREASVLSAVHIYEPDVIGLIDGVFLQELSVWHKEILYALEHGITVLGASSMGALRAAELSSFGMIGVGWIYQQYASGALQDDDEVALAHVSGEFGYRKQSEPLVNIRATLLSAIEKKLIDGALYEELVACVKSIYFQERNLDRMFAAWAARGFSPALLEKLRCHIQNDYVDVKRNDAIQLLETIRHLGSDGRRPHAGVALRRTQAFETAYHRDRSVRHLGRELRLSTIARYAATHHAGFETMRFHSLNRVLTVLLARILQCEASDEDIRREVQSFRASRRIRDESEHTQWLSENNLTPTEFLELIKEVATCRRVHRWWLTNVAGRGRKIQVLLDELRLSDGYRPMAEEAAKQEARLQAAGFHDRNIDPGGHDLRELIAQHCRNTRFEVNMPIARWAEEVGFLSLDDLELELLRAKAARDQAATRPTTGNPAADDEPDSNTCKP